MSIFKAFVADWFNNGQIHAPGLIDAPGRPPAPRATTVMDNVARSLGQASRRDSFKIAATGLGGLALSGMGIRNAWAGDSCLCGGQTYDPTLACCTGAGVVQKNPIADLANCPNRVANPLHTCVPNGCGGEGGVPVPNSFLGIAPFRGCCNSHDCCYDTCNQAKGGCDTDLLGCLSASCLANVPLFPPQLQAMCQATALTYYAFVGLAGEKYYDAAQKLTCDCCADEGCPDQCAGGVCGAFPACTGGGDCVCFQTPEGGGACIHGSYPCSEAVACSSSSDCPPGFGCAATNCCGTGSLCGPLCSDVAPSGRTALPKATKTGAKVRTLGSK